MEKKIAVTKSDLSIQQDVCSTLKEIIRSVSEEAHVLESDCYEMLRNILVEVNSDKHGILGFYYMILDVLTSSHLNLGRSSDIIHTFHKKLGPLIKEEFSELFEINRVYRDLNILPNNRLILEDTL